MYSARTFVTVNGMEGAAYGAALLAGVGPDVWTDTDVVCWAPGRRPS
jgi:hypothetical protein